MSSVKQCASKRNSSRVNSAYVDIIVEGVPSIFVDSIMKLDNTYKIIQCMNGIPEGAQNSIC